jgi:hypothetical protein
MKINSVIYTYFLILCLLLAFQPARAERYPHERTGFYLGLGVGFGNAGADVTIVEDLDRESGGTGNFRIGWMVRDDLALGLESTLWKRPGEGDVATELNWTFSVTSVAVTYFPGGKGAYLRGGIGIGTTSVELDVEGDKVASDMETGAGFDAAVGYEWRITKNLALAPQIEFAYLEINGDITNNVDFIAMAVRGTWYW